MESSGSSLASTCPKTSAGLFKLSGLDSLISWDQLNIAKNHSWHVNHPRYTLMALYRCITDHITTIPHHYFTVLFCYPISWEDPPPPPPSNSCIIGKHIYIYVHIYIYTSISGYFSKSLLLGGGVHLNYYYLKRVLLGTPSREPQEYSGI